MNVGALVLHGRGVTCRWTFGACRSEEAEVAAVFGALEGAQSRGHAVGVGEVPSAACAPFQEPPFSIDVARFAGLERRVLAALLFRHLHWGYILCGVITITVANRCV